MPQNRRKNPREPKQRASVTRDLVMRPAVRKDAGPLVQLAAALNEKSITKATLTRHVFGRKPAAHLLVAVLDGDVVAAAFYVNTYDVPSASRGLFINKFLIGAVARTRDVGAALTAALAALAKKQNAAFLHWGSDAWNVEDHDRYRRLGAAEVPIMAHAIDGLKFAKMAKAGAAFLALKK